MRSDIVPGHCSSTTNCPITRARLKGKVRQAKDLGGFVRVAFPFLSLSSLHPESRAPQRPCPRVRGAATGRLVSNKKRPPERGWPFSVTQQLCSD
jgi:hypothetical protein